MTANQKKSELKELIIKSLTSLITNDYILLGLPYYPNVGDLLIWQGSLDFLKKLPYKCLYSSSIVNYQKPLINKDTIILLMGGGNFSDLYYGHQNFRKNILTTFPDNKIIMLPQSIYYYNIELLKIDADIFQQHNHLTMCVRDKQSLKIANEFFSNAQKILLPDMAFCIDLSKWIKYIKPVENRILLLDRKDIEENNNKHYEIVPPKTEKYDWLSMEKPSFILKLFYKCKKILTFSNIVNNYFSNICYKNLLRKKLIKEGIIFLSVYSYIYTTRLHGGILSLLLEKNFTFFDNSYGKNKSFYETWLNDVETIQFIN